jgi:hypothetical protein
MTFAASSTAKLAKPLPSMVNLLETKPRLPLSLSTNRSEAVLSDQITPPGSASAAYFSSVSSSVSTSSLPGGKSVQMSRSVSALGRLMEPTTLSTLRRREKMRMTGGTASNDCEQEGGHGSGKDPKAWDHMTLSKFDMACKKGAHEMMNDIIKSCCGEDAHKRTLFVNIKDQRGSTMLLHTAQRGFFPATEVLLRNKVYTIRDKGIHVSPIARYVY